MDIIIISIIVVTVIFFILHSWFRRIDRGTVKRQDEEVIHKVYLTLDDGPSPYTEEILDILDRYDVKATFFVVGKESDADKDALRQIVEKGHSLGVHSYSHKYDEIYASVEDFAADYVKLRSYLKDVTGVTSNIYRFPGGSSNTVSRINIKKCVDYLKGQGVRYFDWNVDSGDSSRVLLSADMLVENSLNGIQNRETTIILLHDLVTKPTTVQALPMIIESILVMDNTVILPITEDTETVQHRISQFNKYINRIKKMIKNAVKSAKGMLTHTPNEI